MVLAGEPYQEIAVKLKEDFVSGLVELCAPSFIVEEVANVLWRAVKLARISEKDTKEALGVLKLLPAGVKFINLGSSNGKERP